MKTSTISVIAVSFVTILGLGYYYTSEQQRKERLAYDIGDIEMKPTTPEQRAELFRQQQEERGSVFGGKKTKHKRNKNKNRKNNSKKNNSKK